MQRFLFASVVVLAAAANVFGQAGAPPNGFTTVAQSPTTTDAHPNYGMNPKLVLDASGEPVTVFLSADPNGDNNYTDGTIFFASWNHAQAKFNAPVEVVVAGNVGSKDSAQPFSFARDASTNLYGIAYVKPVRELYELHLTTSKDNGDSWQDSTIPIGAATAVHNPSLQFFGGSVYLTWLGDGDGIRYTTGKISDDPAKWVSQLAPYQAGYSAPYFRSSLALDSSGAPALAYMLGADSGYDVHLLFWRPGAPIPTTITTSNGIQNGDPDIELSFFGLNPRIAFVGALDSNYFADYVHTLWVSQSIDGGNHWSVPANLPSDNQTSLDPGASLAIGSQGQAAIALTSNGGHGDFACGTPKISLSDVNFSSWKTCGPVVGGNLDVSAGTPSVVYGPNDRLYVVFQNLYTNTSLPYGVNLFSSTVSSATGPVITAAGVTNGASFKNSVSAGALTSLFGSNFATDTAKATSLPLPITLDTVSPVSVSVNGEKVPLLFVNSSQINFQIPWDIPVGAATINVMVGGLASNTVSFPVLRAAPGIIVYDTSRAVATDASGGLLGTGTPTHGGSTIILYMIGSGPVSNTPKSGEVSSGSNLSYIQSSVSATVGSKPAVVSFAGLAPYFVGLVQLNLVIPAGLSSGDQPLIVTIDSIASNTAVINVAP